MAEVKFTEKELGFINDCVMGEHGVLKEMPARPFPSLYRKGVIEKKGDEFFVGKQFRDMFYTEEQVVDITPDGVVLESDLKPKPEAGPKAKSIVEVYNPDVTKANEPFEGYMDLMRDLCDGLDEKRSKDIDECDLIEKVPAIHFKAKRAREAEGDACELEQVSMATKRPLWIRDLAPVVAAYFGVEAKRGEGYAKKRAVFVGEGHMAAAARIAFDYLYKIGNRRAQRHYDSLLFGGSKDKTHGVYEADARGYIDAAIEIFGHRATDVLDESGEVVGEASAIEMSVQE